MVNLLFFKQYLKMPGTVGAVLPSSEYLAQKMVEDITFDDAEYIVEYGPGTGVFTEKLIEGRRPGSVLLLIEYNDRFYKLLKDKYEHEDGVCIVNGSAEDINKYLNEFAIPYADYVVSGLPFASLPKEVSENILYKTRDILNEDGRFITFQYTLLKKGLINSYFKNIEIKREIRNIPPAYVLSCSKN